VPEPGTSVGSGTGAASAVRSFILAEVTSGSEGAVTLVASSGVARALIEPGAAREGDGLDTDAAASIAGRPGAVA
jgi:hypothetical protein